MGGNNPCSRENQRGSSCGKLKIEYYNPFPLEIERFFIPGYQPVLNEILSEDQMLSMVQFTLTGSKKP